MAEEFLVINTEKAIKELATVEEKRKEVEKGVKKTTETTNEELGKTWMKAVSVMQGTWAGLETIMQAMGIAIPTLYRTIFTSVFAAAKILIPLFTSMELTMVGAVQGFFGLIQIGIALAAAIQAQREETKAAEELSNINSMISGISSMMGVWSF